jgi:hypothetical protein
LEPADREREGACITAGRHRRHLTADGLVTGQLISGLELDLARHQRVLDEVDLDALRGAVDRLAEVVERDVTRQYRGRARTVRRRGRIGAGGEGKQPHRQGKMAKGSRNHS